MFKRKDMNKKGKKKNLKNRCFPNYKNITEILLFYHFLNYYC